MLDAISNFILYVMDLALGWSLHLLPMWATLALVAVCTSALLTFIRPLTSNQELLHRCKRDKKRLKELAREAAQRKDKEALGRYRMSNAAIGMISMKAELMPLLASLIPIVFLCVWAFSRIAYLAPRPDQPIEVKAFFAQSAIDHVAVLVPQDGIESEQGYLRRVHEDPNRAANGKINGLAVWTLQAKARTEPYTLTFRYGQQDCVKQLVVDGLHYAPITDNYSDQGLQVVTVELPPYKPLGWMPGMPMQLPWSGEFWKAQSWTAGPWLLDPWLMGYLIVAIPMTYLLKWIFNIC